MHIKHFLTSLRKGADCRPHPLPAPPPLQELHEMNADDARKILEDFLNTCENCQKKNDVALENAMVRIEACAFLRGFLRPFSSQLPEHYSWCPYNDWIGTHGCLHDSKPSNGL